MIKYFKNTMMGIILSVQATCAMDKPFVVPLATLEHKSAAGDVEASFELAKKYYLGKEVKRSLEKATHYYQLAAAKGHRKSQYELAKMYERGETGERSQDRAVEFYNSAAANGHPIAFYRLGKIFQRRGQLDEAERHYTAASKLGEPLAQYELAQMYSENGWGTSKSPEMEGALLTQLSNNTVTCKDLEDEQYIALANELRATATVTLANSMPSKDAYVLYLKALSYCKNHNEACYRLAHIHVKGEVVPKNVAMAKELLSRTDITYVPARSLLGQLFLQDGDYAHALENFNQIETAQSHYYLGYMAEFGLGTKIDTGNALAHYTIAAQQGDASGIAKLLEKSDSHAGVQYVLAGIYASGRGGEKNESKAVELYLKAHSLGHSSALSHLIALAESSTEAQYGLGDLFLQERKEEALTLFAKAAAEGHDRALERLQSMASNNDAAAAEHLAQLYGDIHLKRFYDRALQCQWLTKAAVNGSGESACTLGEIFRLGQSGIKDEEASYDWYAKAAELKDERAVRILSNLAINHAAAQHTMARLHENGRAFTKDLKIAKKYYQAAMKAHYMKAFCSYAHMLETKPLKEDADSQHIVKRYRKVQHCYAQAAKVNFGDSRQQEERLQEILRGFEYNREKSKQVPYLRNYLLLKIQPSFSKTCSHEFLYWAASLTGIARERFSEDIQAVFGDGLVALSRINQKGYIARIILRLLLDALLDKRFNENPLKSDSDMARLGDLAGLWRGVTLMCSNNAPMIFRAGLKRARASVQDVWVDIYNHLFKRNGQRELNEGYYVDALASLRALYRKLEPGMTRDMLWDDEFETQGSCESFTQLLTYKTDTRYKNRIIEIERIISSRLTPDTQRAQLCSWAIAGLHCSTRAEEEMSAFYKRFLLDVQTMDQENVPLEIRIALFLAEFRHGKIKALVPKDAYEYIHQVAHLERKVRAALALVGDAEEAVDVHERNVVLKEYKDMKAEDIVQKVMNECSAENMIAALYLEINKPDSSIPYACLRAYCEQVYKDKGLAELMKLFDPETGKCTIQGAAMLLDHFGYLDVLP